MTNFLLPIFQVTYTDELLDLIYDMALKRLVNDRHYPQEMLDGGLKFDPMFSVRGKGRSVHDCGVILGLLEKSTHYDCLLVLKPICDVYT